MTTPREAFRLVGHDLSERVRQNVRHSTDKDFAARMIVDARREARRERRRKLLPVAILTLCLLLPLAGFVVWIWG